MMAMGGQGSIIERLEQLHIVPLSISYEFDPCDFLKAKECYLEAIGIEADCIEALYNLAYVNK